MRRGLFLFLGADPLDEEVPVRGHKQCPGSPSESNGSHSVSTPWATEGGFQSTPSAQLQSCRHPTSQYVWSLVLGCAGKLWVQM
ncbi:hypothetical protein H6P81_014748 [Aristolochia fimbriata]|uniref:Uncharacterized protein n=1 Tax=Aristolochia fimbriata TaxID=158543 RepID=A0AAV7E3J0_ARIFI|nr:hypothetical protein H6P81_014748 [Aristolochia fimbriata]